MDEQAKQVCIRTVRESVKLWTGSELCEPTLYDLIFALSIDPDGRQAFQQLVQESWLQAQETLSEVAGSAVPA